MAADCVIVGFNSQIRKPMNDPWAIPHLFPFPSQELDSFRCISINRFIIPKNEGFSIQESEIR
jgi:hypothetical protein